MAVPTRRRGRPRKPRVVEYERPRLYTKQEAAFFHPSRYVDIEASTKSGKSTGGLVWLTERALLNGGPGDNYWWVAPIFGQARIMFERWCRYVDPAWFEKKEGLLRVDLVNGARIWFKSGERPDNLYGDDVKDAVLDESSRCREEANTALRSTLTATRGWLRRIGNVKGRLNWWYKQCRKSELGTPNTHFARITAFDAAAAGIFPVEEIEDARHSMPLAAFEELYLCIPTAEGSNPFGLEALARVYQDALAPGPAVAFGIDLGKRSSFTEIVGLNLAGRMCAYLRFQKPWPETLDTIRMVVGDTPTLIDATGVGDPVLDMIRRPVIATGPFPELPEAVDLRAVPPDVSALLLSRDNIRGKLFTAGSRQEMMELIARTVQQGTCGIYRGENNVLATQFESFEFQYLPKSRTVRYASPPGTPDDGVFAFGLALEAFRERHAYASGGGDLI